MKWTKLTAYSLFMITILSFSCTSDQDEFNNNYYVGNGLSMSGANVVPSVTTTGQGLINANYSKLSKTLSYSISFSGLSANASAANIRSKAETGYNTVGVPITQVFSSFPAAKSGSYSGTLFFDGVKLKEEDLLAGRFYITIYTATNPLTLVSGVPAPTSNGEIRGQLILTKY